MPSMYDCVFMIDGERLSFLAVLYWISHLIPADDDDDDADDDDGDVLVNLYCFSSKMYT